MVRIEQFRFEFAGYGHYWATYTTPNRGDYWRHIINCMPLIDATNLALVVIVIVCNQFRQRAPYYIRYLL